MVNPEHGEVWGGSECAGLWGCVWRHGTGSVRRRCRWDPGVPTAALAEVSERGAWSRDKSLVDSTGLAWKWEVPVESSSWRPLWPTWVCSFSIYRSVITAPEGGLMFKRTRRAESGLELWDNTFSTIFPSFLNDIILFSLISFFITWLNVGVIHCELLLTKQEKLYWSADSQLPFIPFQSSFVFSEEENKYLAKGYCMHQSAMTLKQSV